MIIFFIFPHIQYKVVFLAAVNKFVSLMVMRVVVVCNPSCAASKLVMRTHAVGSVQIKKERKKKGDDTVP